MPLRMLKAEQEAPALYSPSFAQVRSVLPNIGITARRAKQISSILMIREQREQRKQEVVFNARPFVLCGIPLRPLPKDQLVHRRRNGKFFLHIVGHPHFGLPTVRADCTCVPLAFGMGGNLSSLPPAAGSAI